jgi:uncharacterized OsmC-like protein
VLVLKRITITIHLAGEEDRETVERVLDVYEDSCPIARSIRDGIEITSNLDLGTTARCSDIGPGGLAL